jgi:hypothetical protein
MSRNLKALGLALVAVFAMNAMVAMVASAESAFKFKLEGTPTRLTGQQHAGNDVFTAHTGTVSCDGVTYFGEQLGTEVSEMTFAPTYSECKAFGLFNIPIVINNCRYTLKAGTKTGATFIGSVSIVCPAGKVIEVRAPGCTTTVGSQSNIGSIVYTNIGAGATREVTLDVAITTLKYEEHRPLFGICATNTVATTNGTYNGAGVVTGANPVTAAHRGIFVG